MKVEKMLESPVSRATLRMLGCLDEASRMVKEGRAVRFLVDGILVYQVVPSEAKSVSTSA